MTLKQIFRLEKIPCEYLHDFLKKLLAKTGFDASFMCLFGFVSFCVTLNDLWCWTQPCNLLSRIQLRLTNQSWQTGPNESVLQFEVGVWVCWHQTVKLVQVVYNTALIIYSNYTKFVISSCIEDIATNLPFWKPILRVFTKYFQEIVGKGLFWCFIYEFVWICCISCHFKRFMLLSATLWLTVTHIIMINGPKLTDWSKWICITLWSCFGSLVTTN